MNHSQINGAKSRGPVTVEGKANSSKNSLKHGLNSTRVVLPHESQEEYDNLEAALFASVRPTDEFQEELAREMAAARWRLRRIETMESAIFKKAMREQQELLGPDASPSDVRDAAYAQVAESKTLRTLARNQAQIRRAFEKAWRELETLQKMKAEQEDKNEPGNAGLTPEMIETLILAPLPRAYDDTDHSVYDDIPSIDDYARVARAA